MEHQLFVSAEILLESLAKFSHDCLIFIMNCYMNTFSKQIPTGNSPGGAVRNADKSVTLNELQHLIYVIIYAVYL